MLDELTTMQLMHKIQVEEVTGMDLNDINFIECVTERDIDLLILEELSVNEEFRAWIVLRIFGVSIYGQAIGVWHSFCDLDGETDIQFVFRNNKGQRIALLIENKIDAPPQPEQGERYRKRGANGIEAKYWEEFQTSIIAPKRYLESVLHSESYDSEVGYEELIDFFSSRANDDPRFLYKARIIQEAIEQNRRGYQPLVSQEMTSFVIDYYEESCKSYPELSMLKPKSRPAGNNLIWFKPDGYPSYLWLQHNLTKGVVKLYFQRGAIELDAIRERFKIYLKSNMTIAKAGKNDAAIEIKISQVSSLEPEDEREKIKLAFEALKTLDALARAVDVLEQKEGSKLGRH